ncbi:DNA ligase 4 [Culicoides brevitarsis]|uniref:DNA ligase 4 n=1 Tax=Culicoides brevitarsis TaxID=469753 RepID=UPI00307C3C7B
MSNQNKTSIDKNLPFLPFVKALEAIFSVKSKIGKAEEKKRLLRTYINAFEDAKTEFLQKHGEQSSDTSFYPILRLLLPLLDKTRTYNMKDVALGRMYINVLAINEKSKDGSLLKSGTLSNANQDFGDVVYEVMKDRCSNTGNCTIFDINNFLDKLSEGDVNIGKHEFSKIFQKLTALEHKWLTRIILKNLRLDFSENAILSVFNAKAAELINRIFSLKRICEIVEGDENCEIEPFVPLRPQLCDRMSEKQIKEMFERQKEMYAETKMDGERIQIHKKGTEYRYFTRHGNDCSDQFGKNSVSGCFSPMIHQIFKIPVENVILDGEMMVWDKHETRFVVKGENVTARTMKNHSKYQSCFVVYDILHLNGTNLMEKTYDERISIINSLIPHSPGVLQTVKRQKVRSAIQVLEVLNTAIDECEEGIVLKQLDSIYSPGKRGDGWFKVKPDYLGDLVTDLDLVIIGGIFKRGTSVIQKYLVAIKDDTKNPVKFITVTPIVNNLSGDMAKSVENVLKPKIFDISSPPVGLDFGSYKPNVYFEPSESVILEVKASELQKSSSVSTGFILRFPRVMNVRTDKPPTDCCDLREFKNLCGTGDKVVKLPKRHATEADLIGTHKRSPKKPKISSKLEICNPYTSVGKVEIVDEIAKNHEIAILSSGKDFPPKQELENLVRIHGGTVVAHPGRRTTFCVADTKTPMVQEIIKNRSQTIVTVPWFLKSFPKTASNAEKLPDIKKRDTICMKPDFEVALRYTHDEFDDSYTKELTENELREQLDNMKDAFPLLVSEMNELEQTLTGQKDIFNCFRGQLGYFDSQIFKSVDYKIAKLMFLSRSGTITSDLDDLGDCDLIVVDPKEELEVKKFKENSDFRGKLIDFQYFLLLNKGLKPKKFDYLLK